MLIPFRLRVIVHNFVTDNTNKMFTSTISIKVWIFGIEIRLIRSTSMSRCQLCFRSKWEESGVHIINCPFFEFKFGSRRYYFYGKTITFKCNCQFGCKTFYLNRCLLSFCCFFCLGISFIITRFNYRSCNIN